MAYFVENKKLTAWHKDEIVPSGPASSLRVIFDNDPHFKTPGTYKDWHEFIMKNARDMTINRADFLKLVYPDCTDPKSCYGTIKGICEGYEERPDKENVRVCCRYSGCPNRDEVIGIRNGYTECPDYQVRDLLAQYKNRISTDYSFNDICSKLFTNSGFDKWVERKYYTIVEAAQLIRDKEPANPVELPEDEDIKIVHSALNEAVEEGKLKVDDDFEAIAYSIDELTHFYLAPMGGKLGKDNHIFKRLDLKAYVETIPEFGKPKFLFRERLIGEKQGFSPDFRSFADKGQTMTFTTNQSVIIELMHKHHPNELGGSYILSKLGSSSTRLRDSFKDKRKRTGLHPAWGTLIIKGSRQGLYKLDI